MSTNILFELAMSCYNTNRVALLELQEFGGKVYFESTKKLLLQSRHLISLLSFSGGR